ncbi:unnamed protein product [Pelagomonas calceolata]|uniref:Uncharacterized protein n=1 Tax=Pelagomonas calceolata TaxID=35677 RepID=A0A8J2SNA4_9STRA|nr:unnamed protein product [Pelagomonas calceolata]|mmetsp:Transcript_919/g.2439  ORF Transcript_919/g.2439 Transcript_919/m.2439 type:complete len:308 (-) Transcript_919:173-1096(-)
MLSYHACSLMGDAVRTNFAINRSPRRTVVTPCVAPSAFTSSSELGGSHAPRTDPSARSQRVCESDVFSSVRTTSSWGSSYKTSSLCQPMLEPTGYLLNSTGKSAGSNRSSPQIRRRRSTDSGLDRATHTGSRGSRKQPSLPTATLSRVSGLSSLCRLADRWQAANVSSSKKSSTTQRPSRAKARRASTSESSYSLCGRVSGGGWVGAKKLGRRSVGGVRAFALSNSTSNIVPRAAMAEKTVVPQQEYGHVGRDFAVAARPRVYPRYEAPCVLQRSKTVMASTALTARRRRPGQARVVRCKLRSTECS